MLGLGLINLGFLAATAAIGIPVLIHLLLRPQARRVEIGSLRFLRQALRDSTRRRRVRRWLLLALRCAAVLLLALLFARPYLAGADGPGSEREVLILLDRSRSMAARVGGDSLFRQGLDLALRLRKEQPSGTSWTLALYDAEGVEPLDEGAELPTTPGYAGGDHTVALRWARDRLMVSSRRYRHVILISDLQKSGIRSSHEEPFPEGVRIDVRSVGSLPARNLGVAEIEIVQAVRRAKDPIVISARILNGGVFLEKDVPVSLQWEGPGAPEEVKRTVTVEAGTSAEVRFELIAPADGLFTGSVLVDRADDFTEDNRRWLALDLRPPDGVLLVDGEPGRSVYGHETYFLEAALRLRLADKGPPRTPFEPVRLAWEDGTPWPSLAPFRVVVLCNVPGIDGQITARLAEFVRAGGRLILFTGGRVRLEGYAALTRAGLLPAVVGEAQGPDLFRLDRWQKDHPIFLPLSDPQRGDLRRLAFRHVTTLVPEPEGRVLAWTSSGAPLLVERTVGTGVVLLFGSAADRDWGDWPQSPLYVPLVHQIFGYLAERLPENQRVQSAPAGAKVPPGVSLNGRRATVRNLDPRESEMDAFSEDGFRAALGLPETSEGPGSEVTTGNEHAGEFWPLLVWILMGLLVAEMFVANRTHA